ncbi:MAG: ABC transporter ATP-binding protein [Oscillospiraceae bacterium]|nr:ABC transporter ATP-binding protein [Oscillospiraceae bacterium]
MVAGIIDTAMSFMSRWAIDGFMTPGTTEHLGLFAFAAVGLQLLMAVLTLIYCRAAGHLEAHLSSDVRQAAYTRLQTMSYSYFDKTSTGHLISRLTNDVSRITEMVSWTCIDLGWGIMAVIASLLAMFLVNLKLALITVTAVPVVALISVWFQKKILHYQRKTRRLNSMITSSFNEGIMGAQTSKTLNREALNNEEFNTETRDMFRASMRSATISAIYMPLASLVISLATGFILIAGGHDVQHGILTIGTLNFFINIGNMMFEPIRNFAGIFSEFQSCQAAAERVADVLLSQGEIEDAPEVTEKYGDFFQPKKENWEPIRGDVDFDHVSFWYLKGEPVLTDFNLHVKAGENIALVGETGGGKSTIVNLLCRFYEPREGTISIDGRDYRERSQLWLQSSLGYVLQTPHLFSGTILENIRYGRLEATDEEVREAARLVGADEFIEKLEKGYETDAGEGGSNLSTGQKQLISFARAILADPAIFVLDEATSSIDTVSEQRIQKASEQLLRGRTSFIIAHRLSTVRNADRILVIDGGRILEEGSHRELMKKKGRYYELYENQFRRERMKESLQALSGD